MSIVIQGAESLSIYDSNGNRLVKEGEGIYRQNDEGILERVGRVIPISWERLRFQYVLDPDEYVFSDMIFSDNISPDIIVMNFENWLKTSMVSYLDFQISPQMKLNVTPHTSQLYDIMARSIIEPTYTASIESLQQINEAILERKIESE